MYTYVYIITHTPWSTWPTKVKCIYMYILHMYIMFICIHISTYIYKRAMVYMANKSKVKYNVHYTYVYIYIYLMFICIHVYTVHTLYKYVHTLWSTWSTLYMYNVICIHMYTSLHTYHGLQIRI